MCDLNLLEWLKNLIHFNQCVFLFINILMRNVIQSSFLFVMALWSQEHLDIMKLFLSLILDFMKLSIILCVFCFSKCFTLPFLLLCSMGWEGGNCNPMTLWWTWYLETQITFLFRFWQVNNYQSMKLLSTMLLKILSCEMVYG